MLLYFSQCSASSSLFYASYLPILGIRSLLGETHKKLCKILWCSIRCKIALVSGYMQRQFLEPLFVTLVTCWRFFLYLLLCSFICIWLFHNIRPLYVILPGSGLDKWNISAHTSQSCQQFPTLPCICCVLLWGTHTLSLSHTSSLTHTQACVRNFISAWLLLCSHFFAPWNQCCSQTLMLQ